MDGYTVGQVVIENSIGVFDKSGWLCETNPDGFDLREWKRGYYTKPISRTMTVEGERIRNGTTVPVVKYTDWQVTEGGRPGVRRHHFRGNPPTDGDFVAGRGVPSAPGNLKQEAKL